ncbi:MAG: AEC family transporter [Azoarcus sp.]|jgi:predicted permease|nr:AEC family transporter [Azoarcus sp.]
MAIEAFILILSMFAVGYAFARRKVLPDNAADVLNRVVLYLCFPAAILLYLPRLHFDWGVVGLAATPWLLGLAAWGALWLAARRFHFRNEVYAALLLCTLLGNTGFVGYPMIRALRGEETLAYAVVYDQFGNGLILSTFGMYICARYSGGASPSLSAIARRVLLFPPTVALILALTIMPENPPGWLGHGLKSLADALLPLVMLAVGLSLRFRMPSEEIRPLAVGLALKLVILPALVLGGSLLAGLRGDMLAANVLETAMPPMITAGVLAIAHNFAPRLAAALVGYGLLVSMLTVPAWAWILRIAG